MNKEVFIENIKQERNYFYAGDLLSNYYVGGNFIGKRRKPEDPQPEKGNILIIYSKNNDDSYTLKPYGWYDEMYFTLQDIKNDNSVNMRTFDSECNVVNEYTLFLEDLRFWEGQLPSL
jgi:hypothetical protein